MKRIAFGFLTAVSCLAFADTETIDGYTWTFGDEDNYSSSHIIGVDPKAGEIVIPSVLGGRPVRTIDSKAFVDGVDIVSITVPNTVKTIYGAAFNNCINLKRIVLPSSIEFIGVDAFGGCSNIVEATLPGSVEYIFDTAWQTVRIFTEAAFPSCASLKKLVVADGSASIHDACFYYLRGVEKIEIPASVKQIGPSAFGECYNLDVVEFKGDAPICKNRIFDYANNNLIVRVPKGSKGWDGDADSTKLPKLWPHNNTCGRPIIHIGDPLPHPEPLICTNYVFSTITNHIYHHDVVTDMTAYHTTVTNVHVHYLNENAQPTFVFPSGYDTGFINVVAEVEGGFAVIPATWTVNYPGFTEKYGSDFSKALNKPNGKYDRHGNPMFVWQDYVAGTSPMDVNDVFDATIAIEDGKVVVSHTPVLDEERAALRKYTVYGKKNLMDSEWKEVEPGEELDYNFYRVTVRMK